MAKYCSNCGNAVMEGAKFCRNCGHPLAACEPCQKIRSRADHSVSRQTDDPEPSTLRQDAGRVLTASMPHINTLTAASEFGEVDLGELVIPGPAGVDVITEVFSPISGIFHGIGSFFSGVFRIFRKPSALIGTVLLAVLWFVLARLRGSDSQIVKILSFLTFSEGGLDRSALGAVGGILGKGTVAAALASLFSGGLKDAFRGVGALFTGHGEKRGILSILSGVIIGAAAYLAFVGADNASGATAMPGIAGMVFALEALGSGSGKLYTLVQSLTSRSVNGIRKADRGRCDGILTGTVAGFMLAAVLSLFA